MVTARVRLLCVDDNEDVAAGICRAARFQPDIEPVGAVHACAEVEDAMRRLRPEVVLLDLTMPGEEPLDLIPRLRELDPHVRVVVFSGYDDRESRMTALAAGAAGFISKHAELHAIFDLVRQLGAERRDGQPG